jgi:NADH dehydrogenase FAD-containing subunit
MMNTAFSSSSLNRGTCHTTELPCEHDRGHRIVANNYLEVPGYSGVYVLGEAISIVLQAS